MSKKLQTLQDWSNKHVFTSSIDYWNQESSEMECFPARSKGELSRKDYGTVDERSEGQGESFLPVSDTVDDIAQPITAMQAAWNVTNAIQGMFIVGLPIAVKVINNMLCIIPL
ncbi:hypothetical protein DICVIV_13592 [Dictyocaulus viviparus]|uniref:Amino acid transporter transmembrane domain-containing protein n=1 Tax=Dictyocaulus viviparus TaxID=29172 RepID=A0A0D8XDE8_DICVI|nr:hypothetical protein DICVIV_13592 [Dictyocaulus viviparus]